MKDPVPSCSRRPGNLTNSNLLFDERVAEGLSGCGEASQAAVLELGLVSLLADIDVVLSISKHAVDQDCQLPGEDGDRTGFVARLSTKSGAESGLGALQGDRGHAQNTGDASGAGRFRQ